MKTALHTQRVLVSTLLASRDFPRPLFLSGASRLKTFVFWSVTSADAALSEEPEVASWRDGLALGAHVDGELASALSTVGFRSSSWVSPRARKAQAIALRAKRDGRYVDVRGSVQSLAASLRPLERLLWQQELQGVLVVECAAAARAAVAKILQQHEERWGRFELPRGVCADVLLRVHRNELLILHRCTHEKFAIVVPRDVTPGQLLSAAADQLGLRHGPARRFLRRRLEQVTEYARVSVPIFSSVASFASVPVSMPEAWAENFWHTTTLPEARWDLHALPGMRITGSSGSTAGSQKVHLVEQNLMEERFGAETAIWNRVGDFRLAIVNRATNLFTVAPGYDRYRSRRRRHELRVTPGANPTQCPSRRWRRVASALRAYDPTALGGDPQFLLALTPFIAKEDLPSLRQLVLGNHMSWGFQRRALEAHFGVKATLLYHAGETGTIATSCRHGVWHMLETYAHYETMQGGRPTKPGAPGLLVATVFDAKVRPLLRYSLGDIVRLHAPLTCRCGQTGRTVSLEGRAVFTFRSGRGDWVTPARMDALLADVEGVQHMQVARTSSELLLRYLGSRSAKIPVENLAASLGLKVRAERVSRLATMSLGGKLKLFDIAPEHALTPERVLAGGLRLG